MNLILKLFAGFLSSLAIIGGTALAIPQSREFIFNTVAPYSQVYEEQVNKNTELQDAYIESLSALNTTRASLIKAEQKAVIYQSELNSTKDILARTKTNLETTTTQLNLAETNLQNANSNIAILQADLSTLQESHARISAELDEAIENNSENQVLIQELNSQLSILSTQMNELESTIARLNADITEYQNQIAYYEAEITTLNGTISDYETECSDLRNQLVEQQIVIDNLNAEIDEILYENMILSFDSISEFNVYDANDNLLLPFTSTGTYKIALTELLGLDITQLYAKCFSGHCHGGLSNYEDYTFELEGELQIRPRSSDLTVFLWDANARTYVEFNDDNIQRFIDSGYTQVRYTIYAVQYSKGVVTCHLNFCEME